jgi:hypothetical protein
MAYAALLVDSFDAYAAADAGMRWGRVDNPQGFVAGRNGNGAQMTSGRALHRALDPSGALTTYTKILIGIAIKFNTFQTSAQAQIICLDTAIATGGNAPTEIFQNTDGTLSLRRNGTVIATGTTVLATGTWHYIELKVLIASGATGSYELRIDGNVELGPTSSVQTSSAANVTYLRLNNTSSGAGGSNWTADDLVVQDWSVAGVDFLGDVRVAALVPTGAGNYTQFSPSAGSNYQNVDDATPDGDTTYNSDATVGDKDSFVMDNLPTNGTPYIVQSFLQARKDDAGARTARQFLRISGSDYEGTTKTLSDSHQGPTFVDIWNSDPSGGAWNQTKVDGLEAGYKVQA